MKISLGILLGSTYLSRRWNPSEIFAASEPGLWVDPSAVANLNWRRNLLTFSEQFDNAAWTKTGATVVANAGVAPDGTMTADSLVPDTANSGHQVNQIAITTATTTTFSVYAKSNGYNWIALGLTDSGSTVRISYFNLATGVVGTIATGITASIVPASNGWYRCVVTVATALAGNNILRAYAVNSDGNTTFIGNGTSGIFIWGAQLEASPNATSYQPITDLNTELRTLFPNATLFQDAAGTTPVTTPGQTVALGLDRSKGLVLGPELVTNGDFTSATGWTPGTGWTINGGTATFTATGANSALSTIAPAAVSGRTYEIRYTVVSNTLNGGALRLGAFSGASYFSSLFQLQATPGTYVVRLVSVPSGVGNVLDFWVTSGATSGALTIDNISVKELAGNHLTQATAASRPVYGIEPAGGRRNLLTGITTNPTDTTGLTLFGDAAAVLTVVSDTAALAGLSASTTNGRVYRLNNTAGTTPAYVRFNTAITMGTDTWTLSAFARGSGTTGLDVNAGTWSGVSTAVLTTSYQRVVSTGQTSVSSNQWRIRANAGTDLYFILMQAEVGTSVTAYQSALTAFNVTEVGRANMHYLQFDGTDDWMISPTVTPGTDKAQVFAGVRKLSDVAIGTVLESGIPTPTGSISLLAPRNNAASSYGFTSRGTSESNATATSGFASPTTDVIIGLGDIAGDVATLRVDGIQVATSSLDQGTGNFNAAALYVGRRGGSSLPFNGRIYQLIVRFGPNLTPEKLNLTELFVGTKTGFYKPIITGIPTWQ